MPQCQESLPPMKQLRPSQGTGLEGSRLYMQSIEIFIGMMALQDVNYCIHMMAVPGMDSHFVSPYICVAKLL